jgi:hypothetical protein
MPSTAIQRIDYDSAKRELFVTFVPTGKTYVYFGVPADVYRAFREASSRGQYFNFYIRDRYIYREIAASA